MKDLKFKIKTKLTSNKHLRKLKNNYNDYTNLGKFKIKTWKDNHKRWFKKSGELIVLTEEQIREKRRSILDENKRNINLKQFASDAPLVSIIILNRNGLSHLKTLFKDFQENVEYPNYEIMVVDNASTDGSLNYLEQLPFPVEIIRNTENRTFSEANNQAVERSSGEFVILLNNDVEPAFGWLNQMMQAALRSSDTGAVGAKLVYPASHQPKHSFKIQHAGISFRREKGFIKPFNLGEGVEPFDSKYNQEQVRAGLTAAALLVAKETYQEVGGLDEGYAYGYEDIDFCLKLLKKGYRNIYCPQALLFHHEFGTQEYDSHRRLKKRRLKNQALFQENWGRWLDRQFFKDKINKIGIFSKDPLKVALVVTEVGLEASAGDYFTASELGECLKEFGWEISFLVRKGPGNWYQVDDDIDVVISFLEAYDPGKIMCNNKALIKIAWARNWFERWANNPSIGKYDLIFASSVTAGKFMEKKTEIKPHLLPIATNPERFNDTITSRSEYLNDFCFTGSYWDDPRDIVEFLEPESLPYDFKLFGKNWDKFEKFKNYYQGFVEYSQLPEIYASSKIVIDDVNRGSKKFGAVNSRVYDALASGTLVITNDKIGAQETFQGKLPFYNSKEDLNKLIDYYLTHDEARKNKIKELQNMVLEKHTYKIRGQKIKHVLYGRYVEKTNITIKIPAPSWKNVKEWGDYYLAGGLKKVFEKNNCQVQLQVLSEWNNSEDRNSDMVLVLRGLSKYHPKKQHYNVMWNISHPDDIKLEEYNRYDQVFIASNFWAEEIRQKADVPVDAMLQCTDPEVFYPTEAQDYRYYLLFVGNSRKVYRKILKDLLPTDHDLAVYGTNWKNIIPEKYVKGEHIPNDQLRKAYSSCRILLNDHWDDMRDKGFVSNRLFDGFAAGAFIISDRVRGAGNVFGESLITYDEPDELRTLIEYYLDHEDQRIGKSREGHDIVVKNHTYQQRAEQMLEIYKKTTNYLWEDTFVKPQNSGALLDNK